MKYVKGVIQAKRRQDVESTGETNSSTKHVYRGKGGQG